MTDYISFKAKIRLWNNGTAPASWHFVTLPKKARDEIQKLTANQQKK
jgi:hypothetical protein